MSKRIDEYAVIVVVIGKPGCPACEEYIPRFRRVAKRYACVPFIVIDGDRYEGFSGALGVKYTPTTTVLRYGRPTSRPITEAVDDAQIAGLFDRVMRWAECE